MNIHNYYIWKGFLSLMHLHVLMKNSNIFKKFITRITLIFFILSSCFQDVKIIVIHHCRFQPLNLHKVQRNLSLRNTRISHSQHITLIDAGILCITASYNPSNIIWLSILTLTVRTISVVAMFLIYLIWQCLNTDKIIFVSFIFGLIRYIKSLDT